MILKNLHSFMKGHSVFFFLTLLCIYVSSVLMLFGYGMYQNYMLEKQEFDANSAEIRFNHKGLDENGCFIPKRNITKKELDQCISMISVDTWNCIEVCAVELCESNALRPNSYTAGGYAHFQIKDGVFQPWVQIYKNGMEWPRAEGRFFTADEYAAGAHYITLPPGQNKGVVNGNSIPYEIGDTVMMEGEEFEIIAFLGGIYRMVIYTAVPDTAIVGNYMWIEFQQPPTYAQYEEVMNAFAPLSDRLTVSEYKPFYEEDYWLYNTIMLVSVLIAVVAAFNLVVLYQYILHKRQKALAICQICGCTKGRAIWMYSIESVLLMIPTFCVAALSYHYGIMPMLAKVFPYITTAYSLKLYGIAFIILTFVCLIAMLLLSTYIVRKYSIVERKGGVT